MKAEDKYAKSMKDKGHCKTCVWVPLKLVKQLRIFAAGLRATISKKCKK